MLKLVLAAIAWLQPSLELDVAKQYAEIITVASKKHEVDPLLVAAIIHRETGGTWNKNLRSGVGDHGLMQVRVSHVSSSQFLGRESLLLDPRTNINRGVYLLAWYKRQHQKCRHPHHYWDHFKWGTRVPKRFNSATDWATRIYKALIRRFITRPESV